MSPNYTSVGNSRSFLGVFYAAPVNGRFKAAVGEINFQQSNEILQIVYCTMYHTRNALRKEFSFIQL